MPPLEGFVMNRVQGDYFETLLYKIFVSIDEHTNVAEVSKTHLVSRRWENHERAQSTLVKYLRQKYG